MKTLLRLPQPLLVIALLATFHCLHSAQFQERAILAGNFSISITEFTGTHEFRITNIPLADSPAIDWYVDDQFVKRDTPGFTIFIDWSTPYFSHQFSTEGTTRIKAVFTQGGVPQSSFSWLVAVTVPTIQVSPSSWSVSRDGGMTAVAVTANVPWTVASDQAWLTVSPASGSHNGSIVLTASSSPFGFTRNATVTVSGMGISRTIAVAQSSETIQLAVSPTSWTAPSGGGGTSVAVSSTVTWTASSNQPWLTVSPSGSSGNGTLTLTASANQTGSQRGATVTVAGSGLTQTVSVTQPQSAAPVLEFAPGIPGFFGPCVSTFTVGITSNVAWTAQSSQPWLTVSPGAGSNNGSLTLSASANTTGSSRTATLIVSGGGITITRQISQIALELVVTPTSQSFAAAGGTATFSISTNAPSWTASVNQLWLSPSQISGSGSGSFALIAAANTSSVQRTVILTVTACGLTRTIVLTQAAEPPAPVLNVSPASWSPPPAGGSTTVAVTANVAWTAASNQGWLAASPGNGNNNGLITLTASPNTTGAERSAVVTVVGSGINRAVTITQPPVAAPVSASLSGGAYVAGGKVTVQLLLTPTTALGSLGVSLPLPDDWSYDSDNTTAAVKPQTGQPGALEWVWVSQPAYPYTMEVTLNVPPGAAASVEIRTQVLGNLADGTPFAVWASPNPLVLEGRGYHSTDRNRDLRIGISEMLDTIALYSFLSPSTQLRTGEYRCGAAGYLPGPGSQSCAPHSSDANENWAIALGEILETVALYSYVNPGTGVRSGEYHFNEALQRYLPGPAAGPAAKPATKSSAVAGASAAWTVAGGAFPSDGGPASLTVEFAYAVKPGAVGLEIELPSGWTYVGDNSGAAAVPVAGQSGTLEWVWLNVPASPLSFVLNLVAPVAPTALPSGRFLLVDAGGTPGAVSLPSLATLPCADCNGNGIPDSWELQYFGVALTLSRDVDFDGDGLTIYQEFLLGTDPTNPDTDGDGIRDGTELALGFDPSRSDSVPPFSAEALPAVELRCPARLGMQYQVQRATDLGASSAWIDDGDRIPGDGTLKKLYRVNSGEQAFYRVVEVTP